jgi:hypothetical protein
VSDPVETVRLAASQYAAAVQETERFAARLTAVPGPSELAEYANLLAREEAAHGNRRDAFAAIGMTMDSLE